MAEAPKVPTRLRVAQPDDWLRKAMTAKTPASRARFAQKGLASRAPIDKTTHAMLLRQVYLANFEERRFARALQAAESALEMGVLVDVFHQDAARAAIAAGDLDRALLHLRSATRRGPADRRALHNWTLGGLLFFALSRAARARAGRRRTARERSARHHRRPVARAVRARLRALRARAPRLRRTRMGCSEALPPSVRETNRVGAHGHGHRARARARHESRDPREDGGKLRRANGSIQVLSESLARASLLGADPAPPHGRALLRVRC